MGLWDAHVLTMELQRQSNGQHITVADTLAGGKGGEGRVCAVQQDQTLVAKLYHRPTDAHGRKLATMLANPPLESGTTSQHSLMVWPLDLLYTVDRSRRFVGFLMQRVTGMSPIIHFYNPRARLQQRPWFDYYRLHHTARNLAAAVHILHTRGYVIADVNSKNTLVGDDARVTLIDTDSFQVRDPQNGLIYRCPVGTPEYTPHEIQGKSFASVDRTPEHDLFGLAVLLFQLLMEGEYPFGGIFQGKGEPPPLPEILAAGWFPYGRQAVPNTSKTFFRRVLARWFPYGRQAVPYIPARNAPPFDVLHPTLQHLFVRCFADGHTNPQARPDALTWRSALDEARDALVTCSVNAQHRFGNHLRACPWCERTTFLRGRDPFPSQEAVQRRKPLQSVTAPRTVSSRPRTQPPSPRRTQTPPPVTPPPRTVPSPPRTQPPSPQPTPTSPPVPVNSIGMQFVRIEAGTFLMGSDTYAYVAGLLAEQPMHQVHISTAFYLGQYAVTQGQWQAIMRTNPSRFQGDPQLPVESVSWDDAQEFLRQLNVREGGATYRLPTEAEWEYAARAGTTTAYSYGDGPHQLSEYAWYWENSGGKTHPVGQKKPNPWGLYDMHGNVWEWVQDWYGPYIAGTAVDPAGLPSGSHRVGRGGSWNGDASDCWSAYRYSGAPGRRNGGLGLRLLRTAEVSTLPRTIPPPPRTQTPLRTQPPSPQPTQPPPPTLVNTPPRTVPPPPRTQFPSPRLTPSPPPTLVNNIGMQFVRIEAGTFLLGSNTQDAYDHEKPIHTVHISKAFNLGTYAVTQGQWQAIMGTNPSRFKGDPNLPVENVSWDNTQEFIRQLNAKEGGATYRLPTEAEWEYAARAGTTTDYSFGNDPGKLGECAWFESNAGGRTHPVGQKKPNAWGLHDMHGNVWEWVQDWYGPYTAGNAVDPSGPLSGSFRVIRGGSGFLDARDCRAASRSLATPGICYGNLSVRLLRTAQ